MSTPAPAAPATRAYVRTSIAAPTLPARSAGWTLRFSNVVFVVAVATFFFASGAAGLIYQVAWVRILSLIFGVTVYAVSTVLAGFMAGLALGSYVAGRVAGRIRNPLRAYGFVECGIGLAGLATLRLFAALRDAYPAIYAWTEAQAGAWAGSSGALINQGPTFAAWLPGAIRFLIAFGILLIPTTLMGATLPIILKSSLVRGSTLGRSVSLLYAVNTCGAIAGTVAAGFYLIAGYGVQASIQVAAALNLAVGVAALALSLLLPNPPSSAAAVEPTPVGPGLAAAGTARRSWRSGVVLLAFGLSGLCALGYEVVWFRLLSLFSFENSTYAFTVMLAMVLFGIAAGSYLLTPLAGGLGRRLNWWFVFALLEWGIAVTALLSVTVLSHIQEVVKLVSTWPVLSRLATLDDGWMILAAFAAIVPSMLLSGATFPVAAILYAGNGHDGHDTSRRVGTLYAANVLGAIVGSLVAGFWLLPEIASQRALVVLAAGSAIAALLVLWVAPGREGRGLGPVKLMLTAGGVLGFVWAMRVTPDMYDYVLPARFEGKPIVWYREGLESSVTIVREPEGYVTLYTNSRGQARDEPPLVAFHRLLGHMPMMLHPAPTKVLIVGIGGGTTSGAVALHPGARVDAVELSDAVIDAVRLPEFANVNYRFFDLPNVRVRQADARNHMLVSGERYHVISGDAIRPNDAGAATLYSVEYYRLAAQALEDNGLMTQWLPPFSDYQYKLIMRTFLAAFPYATLWQDGDLLIGSKSPIRIDRAALAARLANPTLKPALDAVGLVSVEEMLTHFNAAEDELRRVVGEGPIITDDRPYIEFFRSLPQDDPPNMKVYSRDLRAILK